MAYSNAAKALKILEDEMARPHRRGGDAGFSFFVFLMFLPLIPVLFVYFTIAVLDLPPDPLPGGEQPAALILADEEAARILATAEDGNETSPVTFLERWQALRTLYTRSSAPAPDFGTETVWQRQVLFLSGLVTTCLLGAAIIAAQSSIVRRHWDHILDYQDVQDGRRKMPTYRLMIAVGLFAVISAALVSGAPEALFTTAKSDRSIVILGLCTIAATGVFTTLFVTAQGAFLYMYNYPRVTEIEEAERLLRADKGDFGDLADVVIETYRTGAWTPTRHARVHTSFSASGSQSVIQSMVRIAALQVVVALITVWLGLQVLQGMNVIAGTASDEARNVNEGWMVAAGLGFSLSLAAIYAWPMVRLDPFASVKAPEPPKTIWTLENISEGSGDADAPVQFSLKRTQPQFKPKKFDAAIERAIGADRGKFLTMVGAVNKGAGFHSVVEGSAIENVGKIVPLIAPAAAGTILGLFG